MPRRGRGWRRNGLRRAEKPNADGKTNAQNEGGVGEPILGTGDIQSLADLGNSYSIIQDMRVVPVTRQAMFQLAVATALPIAPLLLTLMPLEELLKRLFGMIF